MNATGMFALTAAAILTSAAAGDDLSAPGPFEAGWTRVQVTRPDNSTFDATLYYPATTGSAEAPYDGAGAPYPAVSFGHGFLQPVSQYHSTLSHLATWGYFAIASQSNGGLFPDHEQFAGDLNLCLTWLEEQNADAGSPLYEQVAVTCFGLSGHSMGGGASILATAMDSRIVALANLAAAETNPSAIDAMDQIMIPVRLISGSDDAIVPPDQHGQLMYDNGHAPKQHQIIQGGFHCGFVDEWFWFCDSGDLTREEQLAITRRLLTEFFNLHLKDAQDLWRVVWGPELDDDPLVETQFEAGIVVTPQMQEIEGGAGDVVSAFLGVQNTSDRPDSYALLAEDVAWNVEIVPPQMPMLQPGEAFDFEAQIEVPPDGEDVVEIISSARSDLDGATR
ncbi:MAG: hypothetical protein SYC29_15150, partial [Planctomycetota bacterium]|nr:hypothetical protein [Planctomycetota bacterium]